METTICHGTIFLKRGLRLVLTATAVCMFPVLLQAAGGGQMEALRLADFSLEHIGKTPPQGWNLLKFPSISSRTAYDIVRDNRYEAVIHARSAAGSGGLVRPVSLRAAHYPFLSWSWKITRTVHSSLAEIKGGDDFSARVIVSFKEREDQRGSVFDRALCYVWGESDPVDSFVPNPYHEQVITVVAASGREQAGEWVQLSRNVVDDYVSAFGEQPEWISAVTVMTDGDDTGSHVEAWYGPIVFSPQSNAMR